MSPDTGNYAVQWVLKGSTFSNFGMERVTSRNVSMSTDVFRCNGTYTMRVFVMRSDWTVERGHTNENVTPHSDTFDVAMSHPCGGGSTPVADRCEDGGACIVGDAGPGGGIVFYVHPSGTFACGRALQSTCTYLEAAPNGWNGGGDDPGLDWCNVGTDLDIDESNIGGGSANTAKANNTCTSGAIRTVASYTNNGQADWYLPSKSEVNELCKYARQQLTGDSTVGCASSGSVRSGFRAAHYWSSTEISGSTNAWSSEFGFGNQLASNKVPGTLAVRPIRAFGGTLGCADGGECIVGDTGPGGGTIFYVASTTFTSDGSDCAGNCMYLEVAPAPSGGDPSIAWSTGANQTASVTGADGTAIGTGRRNTLDIRSQAGNVAASSAAVHAYEFTTDGASDWYLPSRSELNELCKYARNQTTGNTSVACASSGSLRAGFTSDWYWASSESDAGQGRTQSFTDGSQGDANKADLRRVRAIRAVILPA
jgi:hypothetical protein